MSGDRTTPGRTRDIVKRAHMALSDFYLCGGTGGAGTCIQQACAACTRSLVDSKKELAELLDDPGGMAGEHVNAGRPLYPEEEPSTRAFLSVPISDNGEAYQTGHLLTALAAVTRYYLETEGAPGLSVVDALRLHAAELERGAFPLEAEPQA